MPYASASNTPAQTALSLHACADPLALPSALIDALRQRYAEPHRRYHAQSHIDALLVLLQTYRALAHEPALIEAAIWYHDAVYSTHRSDNEIRSAQLARDELHTAGWPAPAIERVANMVEATQHHQCAPEDTDTALFLDLDLSVLAAEPGEYERYWHAVMEEFHWVPVSLFRRGRRQALQDFLQRPQIYRTPALHSAWDGAARRNLAGELAQLT